MPEKITESKNVEHVNCPLMLWTDLELALAKRFNMIHQRVAVNVKILSKPELAYGV